MYDVIIAGAGPAGSTCARACARQGLKTLLLDRDTFPRSKPCAGAVSVQALSYLDFALPEHIIERECFGVRVHWGDRAAEVIHDCRFAVIVTRKNFDSLLVDKALEGGAGFISGEDVVSARDKSDSVEVCTGTKTYEGRFLIGADGIHSRVARAVRPSLQKDEMAIALVSNVPADDGEIESRLGKTLDLYYGAAPLGYGWLFPHRGYWSTGIAGLASRFSRPREALTELAHSLHLTASDFQAHFIPFGGVRRPVARGRILLVGDAAGFADPFHGEGIVHAIHSGKLAARAVIEATTSGKGPSSAVAQYSRESDQMISQQLKVAFRMATLIDKYPKLFIRLFLDHPEALQRYLDIPTGRINYQQFQLWFCSRLPLLLLPRRRREPVAEHQLR